MTENSPHFPLRLGALICVHIVSCCVSLIYFADHRIPVIFDPATYHIFFYPAQSYIAVLVVAAFALVCLLFIFSSFSFGYFVSFYFYIMILNYLWLNCFTDLNYGHRLAGLSAAVSAVAFLVPSLFIRSPVRRRYELSQMAFDRLLTFILLFAVGTIAVGAAYNFRLVWIRDIYDFRDKLNSPMMLNYSLGITSSTLLPFAFAGLVARRFYWRAIAVLLLLLLFYPITLSKLALFSPLWLVGILLLSKFLEARIAIVLSLLIPTLAGLILGSLFGSQGALVFSVINFRMIAIPAVAMDIYNDFFSRHDLTYFCQISFLKPIVHCPYEEQLAIVMARAYKLGAFNASLFATEGIASVGTLLAPVAALACGLVIAIGNRLSAGLPAGFILVSGAIIPQVLLNVPLTTVLLTHGAALLFLLWYITPPSIFEQRTSRESV